METGSQEKKVSAAFSKQASSFDSLDAKNPTLQWMRKRVHEHVLSIAGSGETILELNCGTGIDAVFFAQNNFQVLATDNAQGMLNELDKKIALFHLENKISTQKLSFNELEKLGGLKFDHVFSNFGGLNCSEDLLSVIKKIDLLLKNGGTATLVIMPRICPWEIFLALKGNFKVAFRRFKKNGSDSHLEGEHFKTYYYPPSYIKRSFGNKYKTAAQTGLASFCPPPYLENFPNKFPRLYKKLISLDERWSTRRPFRSWADHYIISLRKTGHY